MIKYVDAKVTFQEIPDEITLCISISGCQIRCPDCHSKYLWEDVGEPLYISTLGRLLAENAGITCVCFMGGDTEPFEINLMAETIKKNTDLKVAWYSGGEEFPKEIKLKNFDFIKLGPYIKEMGSLNEPTTNQKLYKIIDEYPFNITHVFWDGKRNED